MGPKSSRYKEPEKNGNINQGEGRDSPIFFSVVDDSPSRQEYLNKIAWHSEHEVFGTGPEDLESNKKWEECTKNPGHGTFTPVKEFAVHHLPVKWHREDFVRLIKTWAQLTVRVRVRLKYPSPPLDDPYPGDACGEQRFGTGFVMNVHPSSDPCRECDYYTRRQPEQSCSSVNDKYNKKEAVTNNRTQRHPLTDPSPSNNDTGQPEGRGSWTYHMSARTSIVHSDAEVKEVFVDFCYDGDECRKDGTMKTLKGSNLRFNYKEACRFICVSSDYDLAARMIDVRDQLHRLSKSVMPWIDSFRPEPQVIVSHPHGRPKYVTVGELIDWEDYAENMSTYSTDTCPGSGGAAVLSSSYSYDEMFHTFASSDGKLNKALLD